MSKPKKLPFDTSWSSGNPEQTWRWYEELERLGPENVRIRVVQHDAGSAGAIRGLGTELAVTKGFAEDWLRYRDQKEGSKAFRRFWITTGVALVSAIAAIIAAWPVVRDWLK
jgi:hypothetical protein